MSQFVEAAAEYYVVTIVGVCVVMGMVLKALTAMVTSGSRERSRREIAAYIAEGSMTPEQGERLIRADVNHSVNRAA